jgi:sec-independent protein translocase protein TatA
MRLGPWEIGLILIIVLIVFGAGRLTNIGRDLGKAIRGFREASKGENEEQSLAEAAPKRITRKRAKDDTKTI